MNIDYNCDPRGAQTSVRGQRSTTGPPMPTRDFPSSIWRSQEIHLKWNAKEILSKESVLDLVVLLNWNYRLYS